MKQPVKDKAYIYSRPIISEIPLVFDSPHSGKVYPDDFDFSAPLPLLKLCEDAHIDTLYKKAPDFGAHLLCASFPRSYIDPNRCLHSLNPAHVRNSLTLPFKSDDRNAQAGRGLVWVKCLDDNSTPVYSPAQTPDQKIIEQRILSSWQPYHNKLQELLDNCHKKFGVVYHIDCHSCPSEGTPLHSDYGQERADFILGDRFNKSCAPEFTDLIRTTLEDMGFNVAINAPYAGAALVSEYSDPNKGRHALQIEINRKLYMNEETLKPNEGYKRVEKATNEIIAVTSDYALQQSLKIRPALQRQKHPAKQPARPHPRP